MTQQTKICPFCANEIKREALKCQFCGEWLQEKPITKISSVQNPDTIIKQALAGKFEILEPIGNGGMATVYKAVQINLDRTVALKVVHQNLVHDEEFIERFLREAQISASLNHPNIVTIHDVGSTEGVHYISMEFLDGNDLHHHIQQKGSLPYTEVIKWSIEISAALDYLHNKSLLHRDIKSSNIFIDKGGRPVLTDFGIAHAKETTKLTQAGTIIGTPEYMSPEQAQGIVQDNRSDLYSLGIVLYECLTGRVPYKGDNPFATIHKLINEEAKQPVQINSDIPEWLNSIVLKLIEKAPKDRFKVGTELADAIKEKKKYTNSNIGNFKTQKVEFKEELNEDIENQPEYQKENKNKEPKINRNRNREFFAGNNILLKAAIVMIGAITIVLGSIYFYGSFSGSQAKDSIANIDAVYQAEIGKRKYNKILKKYGMQAIPGGLFWMGDNSQFAEDDAKPIHQVRINNFYIGKYEVTQSLWEEVMKGNPSIHKGTNRPVENVSWNEVQIFINRLNTGTGLKFRLPTEAEWEYAARGISKHKTFVYSGNDDLTKVGWYDENSGRKSQSVGKKQKNGFGLFDMSGNVSEWCQDWYGAYYDSAVVNPLGPRSGALKVVRGGSWFSKPNQCSTIYREAFAPSEKYNYIGFRLVLNL